jgi:hypothetical protein
MGPSRHPNSAIEASDTPSEPRHTAHPASPTSREDSPGPAEELLGQGEDQWIDLGGEG